MTTELKAMGFVVLAVDSVNEAAEYLGPQPPPFELVAVDAVSECAEGVDLLAMAHRIYPNMHCVLVGDAVDSEHLVREHSFLKRGELLLRPWSAQDLRRAATASTG
jgi:DNA-binding NtrC family response regulator